MDMSRETLHARLQSILGLPLQSRCEELTRLMSECTYKELQIIYPLILDSIFGVGNNYGWGLHSTYRNVHSTDYQILYQFLHPQGALFQLCYKLVSDSYLRYDFPVFLLPVNLRQIIEDGGVPPFYLGKIQIDPQTRARVSIALNPFELYMFHFTTHLVNPRLQLRRPLEAGTSLWDPAYLLLAEEYLSHFLPCAPGAQVLPHVPGPALAVPLVRHIPTRPADVPTVFRQSVLNQANTSTSLHTSVMQQNAPVDIWRSETFVQICVDVWLAVGNSDTLHPIRERGLAVDHTRVVRSMVKHFHYFANSVTGDMSTMDELKRVILGALHGKLYMFLQHCMLHWPLDGSFRVVLELWLSYIQPWRYTERRHKGGGENRTTVVCDIRTWTAFLADNLPVYTCIFHQLLPRFSRLDLTLPRNSHMMYRVTKVFSQPSLAEALTDLEASLDTTVDRPNATTLRTTPGKFQNLVQQQLTEIENYEPLFHEPGLTKVRNFVKFVAQSCVSARNLSQEAEAQSYKQLGFFSMLRDFLSGSPSSDITLEDRRKVVAYLDTALNQLCEIFKLSRPDISDADVTSPVQQVTGTSTSGIFGSPFSARDRRQKRIQYEGDPDLQPIQSTEIVFIVKIGYQIASKLNEMYGAELADLYGRSNFIGQVARQVLQTPQTVRSYERDSAGQQRFPVLVTHQLPPRISLRRLASRELVFWVCIGSLASWFRGYHPLTFIAFLLGSWIIIIFARAVIKSLTDNAHNVRVSRTRTVELRREPADTNDISTSF